MAEFDKNKLASGRYFLCLCAGIETVLLTTVVASVIGGTVGKDDPQVHPIALTALTAIISSITGTMGFYFGQSTVKKD